MPDISMCMNLICPKRMTCYSHMAEPKLWQSYASFKYRMTDNGAICENYIPIKTGDL